MWFSLRRWNFKGLRTYNGSPKGSVSFAAGQQAHSPGLLYIGSGDRIFSLDANYWFQTITLLLCHFNFIRKPLGNSPTFAVDLDP